MISYDPSKDPLRDAKNKIILALDVKDNQKAEDLLSEIGPHVGCIKIGLETITRFGGPEMMNLVHVNGEAFYDGKFNDIPNTVKGATLPLAEHNVKMFNVHAVGGFEAIKAAVENRGDSIVLVVTVLTSIGEEECIEIFGDTPKKKVLQFARMAKKAGAQGIVCSPQELKMLSKYDDLKYLLKVIPGIQPSWMQGNDQKRIMTPGEAIKAGADFLVIGRAITGSDDPLNAIQLIAEEIKEAMESTEKSISFNDEEKIVRDIEIKKIFQDSEAIITGSHIVYTSGKHGDAYVNKDAIYPYTSKVSKLCSFIADDFTDMQIDAVVGPVVGGVSLAQWTAHHLSIAQGKEVFAICADKVETLSGKQTVDRICNFMQRERLSEIVYLENIENIPGDTEFVIKRGYDKFITGKNILVVEDILTTGGSVRKVVKAVRKLSGNVVGVGALCNRGNVTSEQIGDVPVLKALMNVTLDSYDEVDCPHCANNVPINTSVGKGGDYLKNKE